MRGERLRVGGVTVASLCSIAVYRQKNALHGQDTIRTCPRTLQRQARRERRTWVSTQLDRGGWEGVLTRKLVSWDKDPLDSALLDDGHSNRSSRRSISRHGKGKGWTRGDRGQRRRDSEDDGIRLTVSHKLHRLVASPVFAERRIAVSVNVRRSRSCVRRE